MNLPPASRYAVSAALCLASLPDGAYHMVSEVAGRTGLAPSYLAKILQRLAQNGLLDSRRGLNGGYRLSRPASEVTLSQIVAASRPAESRRTPCMIEARDCSCARPCSMHRIVALAETSLWISLQGITLAESLRLNFGQAKSEDAPRAEPPRSRKI
jgi:Rrf2 family iron-sulfur cluster assembly transcriptional regulator